MARELGIRTIETVCVASYHDYDTQGGLEVIKAVSDAVKALDETAKVLVVDDPRRHGQDRQSGSRQCCPTARIFATVYAKPLGPPAGRYVS